MAELKLRPPKKQDTSAARIGTLDVKIRPPKVPEDRRPSAGVRVKDWQRALARVLMGESKLGPPEMHGASAARGLLAEFPWVSLGASLAHIGSTRSAGAAGIRASR